MLQYSNGLLGGERNISRMFSKPPSKKVASSRTHRNSWPMPNQSTEGASRMEFKTLSFVFWKPSKKSLKAKFTVQTNQTPPTPLMQSLGIQYRPYHQPQIPQHSGESKSFSASGDCLKRWCPGIFNDLLGSSVLNP